MRLSHLRILARGVHLVILGVSLASCQGGGPTGVSTEVTLSTNTITFSAGADQQAVTIHNLGDSPIDWRLLATSASWGPTVIEPEPSASCGGPPCSTETPTVLATLPVITWTEAS